MSAATLTDIASTASARLLEDVNELHGRDSNGRETALHRLEAALGRDFAQRLVAALSKDALHRLEAALSRDFADRIAALARDHDQAAERGATRVVERSRRST